ncbi:cyclin-D3-1-like isoform X2 [Rutidosis leptorrhynchoides]|uniref:cyclin-D3-1-like isoform X2 n=1 Tax=Rutidosis leptorrhynchoides TaxID=125765 RepID=UPI003A9A3291
MAPSLDFAVSNLLCAEDTSSISYYNDDSDSDVEDYKGFDWNINRFKNQNLSMNLKTEYSVLELPLQNDEFLALLTVKESEQFVGFHDYLIKLKNQNLFLVARQEAVDWISKVHTKFKFGPLCAYLSVNYLDRFLAVYELPDKAWMMQLLAVTCLSLASKMEETEIPTITDLQAGESIFVFEAKTIQRMELIVLSTLNWRMQSVTPFSYIDSFIRMVNDDGQSQTNLRSLILKSTQLILSLIKGIDFLEFQPSEVAAAVAISVVGIGDEKTQISPIFQYAKNKERVLKCMEVVSRGCTMSFVSGTMTSFPESPIGVLEAATLSYKTDDSPTCSKRRKLNNNSL